MLTWKPRTRACEQNPAQLPGTAFQNPRMPAGSLEREPEATLPARELGEEGVEGALDFSSGHHCERLCGTLPPGSSAVRSEGR